MSALGPQTQIFGGFCSWGMVGVSHPAGEKRGKTFLLSSSLPHPGLTSREAERGQSHTYPQETDMGIFSPQAWGSGEGGTGGGEAVSGCSNENTHTSLPTTLQWL